MTRLGFEPRTHTLKVLEQIDLDQYISEENKLSVEEIFQTKGELAFRKAEKQALDEILALNKPCVLSVGGGTPVYYDNMEMLKRHTTTVFLRTPVNVLAERILRSKTKRPLLDRISTEDLPEFIAKHLFERNAFYAQAKYTVDTQNKTVQEVGEEILKLLNLSR